jgi:D-sedoheptulose 7-phosphate isomerase
MGIHSVLMSGAGGGKGREIAGHSVLVPSPNNARVQEMHTFVMHLWMEQIEAAFPA